jgi:hypothetical protein
MEAPPRLVSTEASVAASRKAGPMMRKTDHKRILARATVLLLLFAIAGLSTLAIHSRYLPKSNPIHFISKATKMDVTHHPVVFAAGPLYPVVQLAPPQPAVRTVRVLQPEKFHLQQIGLFLSLQHRSPPSLLA